MAEKKEDNAAVRAAKRNSGLFGGAARGLGSRRSRIEDIINSATTPDILKPAKRKK